MKFQRIQPQYDKAMATLIRSNLEACHLDIPGTAYFDECLDHLSDYYNSISGEYYVLLSENIVIGGIGLATFSGFPDCSELQKLYLADEAKGNGIGYKMIQFIEERARERKNLRMYLETHTNLQAAIHIYEKSEYERIERPKSVVHSTMNRFYLKEL